MGIYLPNMEMPTEGEYNMTLYVCSDGSAYIDVASFPVDKDRFDAVPVPPHGRCVDADAFESIKYELPNGQKTFNRGFHSGVQYVQRLIMDAPTIIPESEDGET